MNIKSKRNTVTTEYILGYSKDTNELVIPQNKEINDNVIVLGKTGSMKTTAYTIPNILIVILIKRYSNKKIFLDFYQE